MALTKTAGKGWSRPLLGWVYLSLVGDRPSCTWQLRFSVICQLVRQHFQHLKFWHLSIVHLYLSGISPIPTLIPQPQNHPTLSVSE
jgi:hypothetical protein